MPSPFALDAAAAAADITAEFGERLRLVPMAKGRYKDAAPDPSRSVREVVGSVSVVRGRMKLGRSELHEDFARTVVAPGIVARIEQARLAGIVLRAGDRVVRLDEPGEPVLEIVAIDPPKLGAVPLVLAAILPEPVP